MGPDWKQFCRDNRNVSPMKRLSNLRKFRTALANYKSKSKKTSTDSPNVPLGKIKVKPTFDELLAMSYSEDVILNIEGSKSSKSGAQQSFARDSFSDDDGSENEVQVLFSDGSLDQNAVEQDEQESGKPLIAANRSTMTSETSSSGTFS